jgi:anti-sigma-K factor RskA
VALYAKDPDYANARVVVAWDTTLHRGSIVLENMPLAPAGHDYQLWVLDPNALQPLNAGVIAGAQTFTAAGVSVARPGFALSLEPTGGSTTVTGPILFAVAPAE